MPLVQSGSPFYLSVDKRLLNHLLGVTSDDKQLFSQNVDSFHLACKKLFSKNGSQLDLRQRVFEKISGKNYSCAICLAAQQVLVVEEMLRDEDYSEHSYFPRYREILEVTTGNQNSTPLTTDSFTKIWETLANEIRFFSGSDFITFSPGTTRRELNRNLPLSQALLTTQDLIKLKRRFDNKFSSEDTDLIMRFILRNRNILGQRGRRVISKSSFYKKQSLSNQFQTFLNLDYDYALLEQNLLFSKGRGKVVAFLDQKSSFLNDKLSFYLWFGEDNYVRDDSLNKGVVERTSFGDVILIADKDIYVELVSDLVSQNSNTIVVLTTAKNFPNWQNKLHEHYGSKHDNYELISSNLPKEFCSVILYGLTDTDVESLFGSIYAKKKYMLKGGIAVDARSKIYLKTYPPIGLLSDNKSVSSDSKIKVNGRETTVQSFFSQLGSCENEAFELEIAYSKINFMISGQDIKDEYSEYGYLINEGRLSPYSELVEGEMEGLVGAIFRGTGFGHRKSDSYLELPILISIIDSSQKDMILKPDEVSFLINYVGKLKLNSILKNFVIQKIETFKTVKPNSKILDFLGREIEA